MELPAYTSLVTLLIVIYYLWIGLYVGIVRGKVKIAAPAVTGDPLLERALRVQMNAVETAPAILPALWLAALWLSDIWAAAVGLVWVLARVAYMSLYMANPASRGPAFGVQFLAIVILIGMGFVGVGMALLQG
ncbi:MAG: MAPEG family protein [Rhodobacterales bacterium]|nr:MAPEG family protein [Rhodobacterales bacterium]